MALNDESAKRVLNKGAWTAGEDRKLAEYIEKYGPKKWRTYSGNQIRCGKSCRLRWLNYPRPNIKRDNISDEEVDLILRLHKLLGNRWSLIAGRLAGRTDNEIKNYWHSHLSKKLKQTEKTIENSSTVPEINAIESCGTEAAVKKVKMHQTSFDIEEFFDFSVE